MAYDSMELGGSEDSGSAEAGVAAKRAKAGSVKKSASPPVAVRPTDLNDSPDVQPRVMSGATSTRV